MIKTRRTKRVIALAVGLSLVAAACGGDDDDADDGDDAATEETAADDDGLKPGTKNFCLVRRSHDPLLDAHSRGLDIASPASANTD